MTQLKKAELQNAISGILSNLIEIKGPTTPSIKVLENIASKNNQNNILRDVSFFRANIEVKTIVKNKKLNNFKDELYLEQFGAKCLSLIQKEDVNPSINPPKNRSDFKKPIIQYEDLIYTHNNAKETYSC